MKLVLTTLAIALATSAVSAAVPEADAPPAQAAARAADRLDLARRFVGITFSADEYVALMHAGTAQMISALSSYEAEEEDVQLVQRQVAAYLAAAEPKVRAHAPTLAEAYAQVYARDFSADELRQMIAFAESPAGKHFLGQYGMVDIDPLVLRAQDKLGAELEPIMDDLRKQMCAERTAQRIAAGDTKAKCPLMGEPDTASG